MKCSRPVRAPQASSTLSSAWRTAALSWCLPLRDLDSSTSVFYWKTLKISSQQSNICCWQRWFFFQGFFCRIWNISKLGNLHHYHSNMSSYCSWSFSAALIEPISVHSLRYTAICWPTRRNDAPSVFCFKCINQCKYNHFKLFSWYHWTSKCNWIGMPSDSKNKGLLFFFPFFKLWFIQTSHCGVIVNGNNK